jgi:hypothetical protein
MKPETSPNDEAQGINHCHDFIGAAFFVINSSFVIRLPRRSLAKAGHSSF